MVQPLPYVLLLFIEHLIDALSGQKNSSGLFIKTLNDLDIIVSPLFSNSGHPCHKLSVLILIDSFDLDIVTLNLMKFTFSLASVYRVSYAKVKDL